MIAVILAGGKGTRLWPMSREARPKQFFDIVGERTLIDDTYRRLLRLFPAEKIFVAASPELRELITQHLPDVSTKNIIIEPERRDTGPAMGFAVALLEKDFPDEPLVFIPSDHYIGDEEKFLRCLEVGGKLVEETGKLVDIGITPNMPNTAMGYTKIGAKLATYDGIDAYAFAGHTEKPTLAVAEKYLQDRSYLWHANYYMWTPRKFLQAIDQHAPELGAGLRKIQSVIATPPTPLDPPSGRGEARIAELYATLPRISFDYAVTEHLAADDVIILRGDFGWSDVGSWNAVHERTADKTGNALKGTIVALDTSGSLVYVPPGKSAVVIGLENIVVVDTGDALLVCRRDQSERVKEAVARLREQGFGDQL